MTPAEAVPTDSHRSLLLRLLHAALPPVLARLDAPDAWRGWRIREPDAADSYLRVVCRDHLVVAGRSLVVAVHLFEDVVYHGSMHNHRWPLAVLPFALTQRHEGVLYEMPWEHRVGTATLAAGMLAVGDGQPWAIEDCSAVFHSVQSREPHGSVNVTDVSQPPCRDNRMRTEAMPAAQIASALRLAAARVPRGGSVTLGDRLP